MAELIFGLVVVDCFRLSTEDSTMKREGWFFFTNAKILMQF